VLQDGAVRAVGDQGLDRRLNRHGELLAGRRLRRRDAVGATSIALPTNLKTPLDCDTT